MTTTWRFPSYRPPHGTPAYWMNDASGTLPAAVRAFYTHLVGQGPAPTETQLQLIRAYLVYVIRAPCWRDGGGDTASILAALRQQIEQAQTFEQIDLWLEGCLAIGIDPL